MTSGLPSRLPCTRNANRAGCPGLECRDKWLDATWKSGESRPPCGPVRRFPVFQEGLALGEVGSVWFTFWFDRDALRLGWDLAYVKVAPVHDCLLDPSHDTANHDILLPFPFLIFHFSLLKCYLFRRLRPLIVLNCCSVVRLVSPP